MPTWTAVFASIRTAAHSGNLAGVQELLKQEPEEYSLDRHEWGYTTPFQAACSAGHIAIVDFLLALGPEWRLDPHAREARALQLAVHGGHAAIVERLLSLQGARHLSLSATSAASWARRFAASAAAGHDDCLLVGLALTGDQALPVSLSDRYGPGCMLRGAAEGGCLRSLAVLLGREGDAAVDVHEDGGLLLQSAAAAGQTEVVRLLLSMGGERALDASLRGHGAVRLAASRGHTAVLQELLAYGGPGAPGAAMATGSLAQEVATAAAMAGHTEALRLLLAPRWRRYMHVQEGRDRMFRLALRGQHVGTVREWLARTERDVRPSPASWRGKSAGDGESCDTMYVEAAWRGHPSVARHGRRGMVLARRGLRCALGIGRQRAK